MKYLKGSDLVEYISERQSKQIRSLVQTRGIHPKLAIVNTNPDHLPSQKYLKLKQLRGEELGIEVEIHQIKRSATKELINRLSEDGETHGVILQLPLEDTSQTEELIKLIPPEKDVDGLGEDSLVEPATVGAILWLLAGYNIDLKNKNILVIGQGKLVGSPLATALRDQNLAVTTLNETSTPEELLDAIKESDIIISAAGQPSLIRPEMLKNGQIIIDAGTTEDGGVIRGDVDQSVYDANLDIKITPTTGGVGPLTISYLFENLLQLIDRNS